MIYITGDTHGEIRRFNDPAVKKLKNSDTLIICGDFGFIWDGGEEERKLLEKLGKHKYQIAFIDGGHENFDLLEKYPVSEWNGGKVHHISGNLYHLMRGQIYQIEGKTIFTFGGGESPDKEMRVELGKWWEREMPTISEMREAVSSLDKINRQVDYVITHEPPTSVHNMMDSRFYGINALDTFLDELANEVKFKKWFFGCLHIDRKITAKYHAVFSQTIPAEPIEGKKKRR